MLASDSKNEPLLTLCVLTQNRVRRLQDRLLFLRSAVVGFEDRCELLALDNGSEDATSEQLDRWRRLMPDRLLFTRWTVSRPLADQLAYAVRAARGRFVWIMNESDAIDEASIPHLLRLLAERNDLAGAALNARRHVKGQWDRGFRWAEDSVLEGPKFFSRALEHWHTGLTEPVAMVYRRAYAREAVDHWLAENTQYPLYVAGHVAMRGPVAVTRHPLWTWGMGRGIDRSNPVAAVRQEGDTAAVLSKLIGLGYSRSACNRAARQQTQDMWRILWRSPTHWWWWLECSYAHLGSVARLHFSSRFDPLVDVRERAAAGAAAEVAQSRIAKVRR